MKAVLASLLFLSVAWSVVPEANNWPYWRGPAADGMATGDAPLHWSDNQNIKWTADIPGRGHSSPVIWGDKIFVTTAIKIGTDPEPAPAPKRPFGVSGPQAEHKFDVL